MLLALVTSCVAHAPPRERDRPLTVLPALTTTAILAPVQDPKTELLRLGTAPDAPAARLRRAFILISSGSAERATRELNRLVFADPTPPAATLALAHYLLALGYESRGDGERAGYERGAAAGLAADPELRRRIAELAPKAAAPPAPVDTPRVEPPPRQALARSAWQAAAPVARRMVRMGRIERVTVHHSALLARNESEAHAAAAVRAIQKTHMLGNGWGDIGYHFLIDRAGRVFGGRDVQWRGAHAGDPARNKGNVGICLLGNFIAERGGQSPSPVQLAALEQLVTQLCARYRIPASAVLTHRELRATSCPGERLQAAVEQLRRSLAGIALGAGPGQAAGG